MNASSAISTSRFNESRKRGFLLLCIFVFPVILTSILFSLVVIIGDINLKVVKHESKFATIKSPKTRSVVSKQFVISGKVDTPLSNHTYYLLEYRNKLFWPKFDLGNKSANWSKELTFRANKNQYSSYQIVMANPELKKTIDQWFKTSRESGQYPGIDSLNIDKVVANIKVKAL